jgi:hypothetical protein
MCGTRFTNDFRNTKHECTAHVSYAHHKSSRSEAGVGEAAVDPNEMNSLKGLSAFLANDVCSTHIHILYYRIMGT